MTFNVALKKLQKMAGDKACKLNHGVFSYGDGETTNEISCYIAGIGYTLDYVHETFESALAGMAVLIAGLKDDPQIKENV